MKSKQDNPHHGLNCNKVVSILYQIHLESNYEDYAKDKFSVQKMVL